MISTGRRPRTRTPRCHRSPRGQRPLRSAGSPHQDGIRAEFSFGSRLMCLMPAPPRPSRIHQTTQCQHGPNRPGARKCFAVGGDGARSRIDIAIQHSTPSSFRGVLDQPFTTQSLCELDPVLPELGWVARHQKSTPTSDRETMPLRLRDWCPRPDSNRHGLTANRF